MHIAKKRWTGKFVSRKYWVITQLGGQDWLVVTNTAIAHNMAGEGGTDCVAGVTMVEQQDVHKLGWGRE